MALEDGPFDDSFPLGEDITIMLWAKYFVLASLHRFRRLPERIWFPSFLFVPCQP
jgi:hypothetical protein